MWFRRFSYILYLLQVNLTFSNAYDSDLLNQVQQLGYQLETHNVTTEDGYILSLFRIPGHRTNCTVTNSLPVFLFHGITFSMNQWLVLPGESSAYELADAGFDVWLGNARGTSYSKGHVSLSQQDPEYWNFSWHEIGVHDIPAIIDYILSETEKPRVHFIGHSQGGTTLMVALSTKPEYNAKIASAELIAPGNFAQYTSGTAYLFPLEKLLRITGASNLSAKFLLKLCKNSWITSICGAVIPLVVGAFFNSPTAFTTSMLLGEHLADYASTKQLVHLNQMVSTGKFQMFDYNSNNLEHYGTEEPPNYNLGAIDIPITVRRFSNDLLVNEAAINTLTSHLKFVQSINTYPANHIEFLFDANLNAHINRDIIENFKLWHKAENTRQHLFISGAQ